MSYDLRIWSRRPVEMEQNIKLNDHEVSIDPNMRVEQEDIPTEILLSLSDICYLTDVNIQPIQVEPSDLKRIKATLRAVARTSEGILEDPQTDEIYLPTNIKKAMTLKVDKKAPSMSISWYMDPKIPLKDMYGKIVDIFEQYLPQALPRRYGLFEPPQFKFSEMGKTHLISFLQNEESIVWYATKPVSYVFISEASGKPTSRLGFRCNRIELQIAEMAFNEKNWNFAVVRLFREMAKVLGPFYAEIIHEEMDCIKSWWWKGLPQVMGDYIIIGSPYSDLIPNSKLIGEKLSDNLYYVDQERVSDLRKRINRKLVAPAEKATMNLPDFLHRLFGKDISELKSYAHIFPFTK